MCARIGVKWSWKFLETESEKCGRNCDFQYSFNICIRIVKNEELFKKYGLNEIYFIDPSNESESDNEFINKTIFIDMNVIKSIS